MEKCTQLTLLSLSIWLILSGSAVNAAPLTPEASDVKHHYYADPHDPDGQIYHRFLPAPEPEELFYDTRMKAIANIDDTPEKETVVLMVVDTRRHIFTGNWVQAYLLITDTKAGKPEKKDLFKLYDTETHPSEVPSKSIEFHNVPFVFAEQPKGYQFHHLSFRLVDLTGDGTLDIWVELSHAVAVISFQNGEFKDIFSRYTNEARSSTMVDTFMQPEYVDMDNDGSYELKIPSRIAARALGWISLYEWNGNTYVLNNRKFYAENDDLLREWLRTNRFGDAVEPSSFYIGLIYYYRDNVPLARKHLQSVVSEGETKDYIQTAEALLKKLPLQRK